jgi:hypothetical protein
MHGDTAVEYVSVNVLGGVFPPAPAVVRNSKPELGIPAAHVRAYGHTPWRVDVRTRYASSSSVADW